MRYKHTDVMAVVQAIKKLGWNFIHANETFDGDRRNLSVNFYKLEKDPEAWREEYRKKQEAGVKFERLCCDGKWEGTEANGGPFNFTLKKEDYREVPQESPKVKEIGVGMPEAAREILKGWHKQGLKFNCGEIFLCLEKPQFSDRREYYTINKQSIPSGMSVETVEAMWRQGLMLEFDGNFGWDLAADGFDWNGIYRGAQLLARLRIPTQPIPEKLLEVPQEVFASECQKKALEHLAKTYSADKGTAQLNPTIPPHAAERALWKAQREAGTNEAWISTRVSNGATCEIPAGIEPGWHEGHVYRVQPMKLTAKIIRRGVYKTSYCWGFTGTREEYRAECEKYGYVVVGEIKEVEPKTVTYYFALIRNKFEMIDSLAAPSMISFNRIAEKNSYIIIGDIEEREVEV